MNSILYIGIKNHVVAIRKSDGSELWRTRLRGSGVTSVCAEDNSVFASCRGRLYRLDAATGNIVWMNGLSGLGYGVGVMGTQNQSAAVTLHIMAQQAMVQAAAASAAAGATAGSH